MNNKTKQLALLVLVYLQGVCLAGGIPVEQKLQTFLQQKKIAKQFEAFKQELFELDQEQFNSSSNFVVLNGDLIVKEDLKNWHFKGPNSSLSSRSSGNSYQLEGVNLEKIKRNLTLQQRVENVDPVVVAINDSGTNYHHKDIAPYKWMNPGERYQQDGDENGKVFDLHGWNWLGRTNGDTLELSRLHFACEKNDMAWISNSHYYTVDFCADVKQEYLTDKNACEQSVKSYKYYAKVFDALDSTYNLSFKDLVEKANTKMKVLKNKKQSGQKIDEQLRVDLLDALFALKVASSSKVKQFNSLKFFEPKVQNYIKTRQDYIDGKITDSALINRSIYFLSIYPYSFWQNYPEKKRESCDYLYSEKFYKKTTVNYTESEFKHYGNAHAWGPRSSHGTHVADSVTKIIEYMYGSERSQREVKIMINRVTPGGDERDVDVANAVEYAVKEGAHIINMSFGKSYSPQKAKVDKVFSFAEQNGTLLNVSAGNSAKDVSESNSFPSPLSLSGHRFQNMLFVGASNFSQTMIQADDVVIYNKQGISRSRYGSLAAGFTNFSKKYVDVFAPGTFIFAADSHGFYDRDSYDFKDGTSMASPVVSGVAALVLTQFPNLKNKARILRQIITASVRQYSSPTFSGPKDSSGNHLSFDQLSISGGVVDAYNAMCLADAWSRQQGLRTPRIQGCEKNFRVQAKQFITKSRK